LINTLSHLENFDIFYLQQYIPTASVTPIRHKGKKMIPISQNSFLQAQEFSTTPAITSVAAKRPERKFIAAATYLKAVLFQAAVLVLIFSAIFGSRTAHAGWGIDIGYHNPPGANVGVNFTYFWANWAANMGVGSINTTGTNNSNTATVLGDFNMQYLFGANTVRPYLQGGITLGSSATVGSGGGVAVGTGAGFLGGGIMLKGRPVFGYVGGHVFSGANEICAGIGYEFGGR
jgi:hypothetical protein